jgi:hypothetical protein
MCGNDGYVPKYIQVQYEESVLSLVTRRAVTL